MKNGKREINELIAWAESQGATVEIITGEASIYEDGSACYRVTGLRGCGPYPLPPIAFAELMRERRAQTRSHGGSNV